MTLLHCEVQDSRYLSINLPITDLYSEVTRVELGFGSNHVFVVQLRLPINLSHGGSVLSCAGTETQTLHLLINY